MKLIENTPSICKPHSTATACEVTGVNIITSNAAARCFEEKGSGQTTQSLSVASASVSAQAMKVCEKFQQWEVVFALHQGAGLIEIPVDSGGGLLKVI